MAKPRGPVLIEMEGEAPVSPEMAEPVPEAMPEGRAMQAVAAVAVRRRSPLARFFWGTLAAFLTFWLSVATWTYVTGLLDRNPILGWTAAGLTGLLVIALLLIALREVSAYLRLARLDRVHTRTLAAISANDVQAARDVTGELLQLYAGRADLSWGFTRLKDGMDQAMDADTLFHLAETELMTPLDKAARREIEAAARTVATVTALVPIALADVVAALAANLRMIRRIAEIYGGRAGAFGGWRLTRTVFTHLLATGAVAVGDDLIQSVAGGGLLSKLSRRFGEGIVNGALTARVGVAAMEVCRPLPFAVLPKPRVTNLVKRALTGLFGTSTE